MQKNVVWFIACLIIFTGCSSSTGNKQEQGVEKSKTEVIQSEEQKTAESNQGEVTSKENHTIFPLEIETAGLKEERVTQKFTKVPDKVLCANLSSVELLLELGRGDCILGMVQRDNEPDGKWKEEITKVPEILNKRNVTMETLLDKSPDLLITKKDLFEFNEISVANLNRDGVLVYTQQASNRLEDPNLETVIRDVRTMGQIFDAQARSEDLADSLEERLRKIYQESEKISEEQTVLNVFNLKDNGFISFDMSNGFHKNLLQLAKLTPVRPQGRNFTYENLVALDPQVILYVVVDNSNWDEITREQALRTILDEPAFQNVSAVKNKKIYFINYEDYMEFGLRSFDAAEDLIKKISNDQSGN